MYLNTYSEYPPLILPGAEILRNKQYKQYAILHHNLDETAEIFSKAILCENLNDLAENKKQRDFSNYFIM